MKEMLGNMVVICPNSPRLFKFRLTSKALLILAISCLISFGLAVAISYTFPGLVSELDRIRLESENQALKAENKTLNFRAEQVNERLSKLEEQSRRIDALLQQE